MVVRIDAATGSSIVSMLPDGSDQRVLAGPSATNLGVFDVAEVPDPCELPPGGGYTSRQLRWPFLAAREVWSCHRACGLR